MVYRMLGLAICVFLFSTQGAFCQWESALLDTFTNDSFDEYLTSHAFAQSPDGALYVTWYGRDGYDSAFTMYTFRLPNDSWSQPEMVTYGTPNDIQACLPKDMRPDSAWMIARSGMSLLFLQRGPTGEWTVTPIHPFEVLVASSEIAPAVDPQGRWHVAFVGQYITTYDIWYGLYQNSTWHWQSLNAQLGPFGSGAAPEMVVDDEGIAHIFYRASPWNYTIQHCYNDGPGGTNWQTETLGNSNVDNYTTSAIWSREYGLCVAISGNEGWGMPAHVYYHRKPLESGWLPAELASGTYSATNGRIALRSDGHPLIVWEQTSGNLYTGNIFYALKTADWENLPLFENEIDYTPLVVMDSQDNGCLVFSTDPYPDDEELYFFGPESQSEVLSHANSPIPDRPFLHPIYPNPTNSGGTISFSLPVGNQVRLGIYNELGQQVRNLGGGYFGAGFHQFTFSGPVISSGWYMVVLETPGFRQSRPLIILK